MILTIKSTTLLKCLARNTKKPGRGWRSTGRYSQTRYSPAWGMIRAGCSTLRSDFKATRTSSSLKSTY